MTPSRSRSHAGSFPATMRSAFLMSGMEAGMVAATKTPNGDSPMESAITENRRNAIGPATKTL